LLIGSLAAVTAIGTYGFIRATTQNGILCDFNRSVEDGRGAGVQNKQCVVNNYE
jgi:hypothetical protein